MSRGPGKVERRLREMLTDPARNSFSQKELIREAFEVAHWDTLTDARLRWTRALQAAGR